MMRFREALLTTLVAVFVCLPLSVGSARAQSSDGGWVPLFNGRNLDGWQQINGTAKYRVGDDMIVGTTVEGSPNSFLCTEKLYGDFELTFDVKVDSRLNSGVQIRSNSYPAYRNRRVHGYQVEIAINGTAGYIYDEARRGWLSRNRNDPKANAAFKDKAWNHYRVLCRGDSIRTWVNGVPVANVTDSMTHKGFIGLQVHGFRGDSPAEVRWRKLFIRELRDVERANRLTPAENARIDRVIAEVEKACRERTVHMVGPAKAKRLAEIVREAKPAVVVECGTAIGYSGLWIARELKAAGVGRLVTIEMDPARAREAEANFRKAGLMDFVTVKVGDARQVVRELEGPIDFVFIDCGFSNYKSCLDGIEAQLIEGAVVVADNAGIGADAMADYLGYVRSTYRGTTEWFKLDLAWAERDAMEITVIRRK